MGLPRATPGKAISASAWNMLVDAVERALKGGGGGGDWGGGGGGGRDDNPPLPATITAVHGTPNSAGLILVSELRYDFVMRGTLAPGTNRVPDMGRPFDVTPAVAGVLRLKPAAVGDRCWIVRTKNDDGSTGDAKLWVTTEKLVFATCQTDPPPGPGGDAQREMQRRYAIVVGRAQAGGASSVSGTPGTPGGGVGE